MLRLALLRLLFWVLLIAAAVLASGCAPARVMLDGEYGTDDGGTASAVMQWDAGPGYVDAGLTYDPLYSRKPRGVVRAGATIELAR